MRVLVACEFSGVVRDAFLARGHDAISCDLLPTESPGPHIVGDVRPLLRDPSFDLVVAFPPCTRLANSGVRWLHERNLWDDLRDGADFFADCLEAAAPRVCVENPVQHKHAKAAIRGYRPPEQRVQPFQFNDGTSKLTCLWLKGLPKLVPTTPEVTSGEQRVWRMAPSPDRAKERARFPVGLADAMAEQWGSVSRNPPTSDPEPERSDG